MLIAHLSRSMPASRRWFPLRFEPGARGKRTGRGRSDLLTSPIRAAAAIGDHDGKARGDSMTMRALLLIGVLMGAISLAAPSARAEIPADVEQLIQQDQLSAALKRVEELLRVNTTDPDLKALRDDLRASTSKPSPKPPPKPTIPKTATTPSSKTAAATVSDRAGLARLEALRNAIAEERDPEIRKRLMNGFLEEASPFLEKNPGARSIWVAQAAAALELDRSLEGREAGWALEVLEARTSIDPAEIRLVARLEQRGWVPDKDPTDSIREEKRIVKARREQNRALSPLVGKWVSPRGQEIATDDTNKTPAIGHGSVSISEVSDGKLLASINIYLSGYSYPSNRSVVVETEASDEDLDPCIDGAPPMMIGRYAGAPCQLILCNPDSGAKSGFGFLSSARNFYESSTLRNDDEGNPYSMGLGFSVASDDADALIVIPVLWNEKYCVPRPSERVVFRRGGN